GRYLTELLALAVLVGQTRFEHAFDENIEDAALPRICFDDRLSRRIFKQAAIRSDLLLAVAAAEQDYVHVELVAKLTVRQFFNKLRQHLHILKCLDDLLVVFDDKGHRRQERRFLQSARERSV